MEDIKVTICPSCKALCDETAKFCNSCGLLLSFYQDTQNEPSAGIVSILSSPTGFVIITIIAKILPKYDFLGFATVLLIWIILLSAGATSIVSGLIALRPTMNNIKNHALGIIGILLGVMTIGSALFLGKWINYLA